MLTVLMATRNRAASLSRTLDAFEALERPAGGHRFVVVDDGSSDATLSLLRGREARLPLTLLHAAHVSANAARNLALDRLEGDLVVLTDDDTIPRPDWLVKLRMAADAHPEVDVVVGTVRPRFEVEPPAWMLAAVRRGPSFGWVERAEPGFVDPTEGIGPSVAIRRSHFERGIRFDEAIGPDGSADYAMGSETSLLLTLQRAGARAWYARDAVVEHCVTAAQIEVPALLRRAHRYGRGRWRLGTSRLAVTRLRAGGVPLAIYADLLARRRAYARALRRGDQARAFKAAWRIAYLAGHVDEIRRARGAVAGLGVLRSWIPAAVLDVLPTDVARGDPRALRAAEPGVR